MPIGPAAKDHRKLLVPSSEVLARLAEQFDVGPLPYSPGSSSRDYRLVDGEGREGCAGVISPCTQPFCVGCNRLRLKANGELVGCLAAGIGKSILPLLRTDGPIDRETLRQTVLDVMRQKTTRDGFTGECCMVTMGG